MRRLGALCSLALCLAAAPAPASELRPRRVVLVSFPGVTWEDVAAGSVPALGSLASQWSVASMSLRAVTATTDLPSGLATISAGNRARGTLSGAGAPQPESVQRAGGGLEVGGMGTLIRENSRLDFGAVPGSLGDELHRLGLRTAVAGNGDGASTPGGSLEIRRFGALALADRSGVVDSGEVGSDLVVSDPSTLNGYRSSASSLAASAHRAIGSASVSLVELDDTYREGQAAFPSGSRQRDPTGVAARIAALRRDDAVLKLILAEVDLSRDSLIVVPPAGPGPGLRERLVAVVMAGVGSTRSGWLTSATTHRRGLITISDIGPTVLHLVGGNVPEAMSGQPVQARAAGGASRLRLLLSMDRLASFHLRWADPFLLLLVLLQVVLYLAAWPLIARGRDPGRRRVRITALMFLSVPLATYLMRAAQVLQGPPPVIYLAAATLVLSGLALARPAWRRAAGPALLIEGATAALILGDLVLGARLQLSSFIGYSPIVAGRFYGIGGLGLGILGTSVLLIAAALGKGRKGGAWYVAGLGALTMGICGTPVFGAKFGSLPPLAASFGVLFLMVTGRRIGWVKAVALAAVAGALPLAAGFFDSLRPPAQQTHLGRFVGRLITHGPGAVEVVVVRKAHASLSTLTHSVLILSIPLGLLFLTLILKKPLSVANRQVPGLREGIISAVVLGVVAFAVNDSGLSIPAIGLAVLVPHCLVTVLGIPEAATGWKVEPAAEPVARRQ